MSERRIDGELKTYYGERRMSSDTIARIRANASAAVENETRRASHWRVLSLAAAVVVAFVAGVFFVQQSARTVAPVEVAAGENDAAMLIANRLVDRHENCTRVDFAGDSLADVVAQMSELGFEPVHPDSEELEGAHFVNAHYCDVNGMRALHAFYTDAKGERLSLFEAPLPPDAGMMHEGMSHEVGRYLVSLTARDGLMIAFTRVST